MGAHTSHHRLLTGLPIAMLAAGCAGNGSSTPISTPGRTSRPAATAPTPTATAAATPAPTETPAPTPTAAPASQAAVVRCAETPDAKPSATVQWSRGVAMGAEPTIKAGQAVAFVTIGSAPTVTEWTNGQPAESPCIDKVIGSDVDPMSVVVSFYQPGDYNIACRVIPLEMHTIVHVR
jgi:plastocyanin